ncbi:cyclin-dependent kinase 4-like [Oratosquilla oratoria]|uniref:cyclin-dependent kinase 4-like n=1 Tax=Oratosquilla oratoria TaxID=337810 RepID=UPI003F77317A
MANLNRAHVCPSLSKEGISRSILCKDNPMCLEESNCLRSAREHRIVKLLHVGRFSSVYCLSSFDNKKSYAYKVSTPKCEEDSFSIAQEAHALDLLSDHPNIVPLLSFRMCPLTKQAGFVMELLDSNLEKYILKTKQRGRVLPRRLAKEWVSHILSGIEFIHYNGLVHFDVSPRNLLITSDGVLQLCGFTSSSLIDHKPAGLVKTPSDFRAPECYLHYSRPGWKSDIWSAGAVFHYLITYNSIVTQTKDLVKIFYMADSTHFIYEAEGFVGTLDAFSKPHPHLSKAVLYIASSAAKDLMGQLLMYDPNKRPSAADALQHAYFTESPRVETQDDDLISTNVHKNALGYIDILVSKRDTL